MTYFWMIRQEDSTGQAASNTTDDVDDTNTNPTNELLHVPHDKQLETNRYQQRKQSATNQQHAELEATLAVGND